MADCTYDALREKSEGQVRSGVACLWLNRAAHRLPTHRLHVMPKLRDSDLRWRPKELAVITRLFLRIFIIQSAFQGFLSTFITLKPPPKAN